MKVQVQLLQWTGSHCRWCVTWTVAICGPGGVVTHDFE